MARIAVIGGNRGIGLALSTQLAARGDTLEVSSRRDCEALKGLERIQLHTGVDVTDVASVEALAATLGAKQLDGLLVVAGILERVSLEHFDAASIRRQFEVNALGPLQTVRALLPCLKAPARVGLITSRMGSLTDNDTGGAYGYRMSKAALNMAGRSLAQDLAAQQIAVGLLHPGYVQTEMTGGTGNTDAESSAAQLIERFDALGPDNTGRFWHANGEELPW